MKVLQQASNTLAGGSAESSTDNVGLVRKSSCEALAPSSEAGGSSSTTANTSVSSSRAAKPIATPEAEELFLKPEITWVQLGREVYARYWEVRGSSSKVAGTQIPCLNNLLNVSSPLSESCQHEKLTPKWSLSGSPSHGLSASRLSHCDANAAHIFEEVLSHYHLVPVPGSAELLPPACPSLGSLLHDAGICKPCVFANKNAKTCRNQLMCYFCHHPHKERRKKRYAFRSTPPDVESSQRDILTDGGCTWRNLDPAQVPIDMYRRQRHPSHTAAMREPSGVKNSALLREGVDSIVSTAPSTTRDDRPSARRTFGGTKKLADGIMGANFQLKWSLPRGSSPDVCSKADRLSVSQSAMTLMSSPELFESSPPGLYDQVSPTAVSPTSLSDTLEDKKNGLDIRRQLDNCCLPLDLNLRSAPPLKCVDNETLLAALLLRQTLEPATCNLLGTILQDCPCFAAASPTPYTAEAWPTHDPWAGAATSREGRQNNEPAREECSGWSLEQEMLGTLINSILVSSSPAASSPFAQSSHCDRSDSPFPRLQEAPSQTS